MRQANWPQKHFAVHDHDHIGIALWQLAGLPEDYLIWPNPRQLENVISSAQFKPNFC